MASHSKVAIPNPKAPRYTDTENALIHKLWRPDSKEELQQALPPRPWNSIRQQATRIGARVVGAPRATASPKPAKPSSKLELVKSSPPKKLRDVKLPLGADVVSNMHGPARQILRKPAEAAVRGVVSKWRGRCPGRHHSDADLQPSINVLERHEDKLADYSPDALRLLASLRIEWSRRYPQQQAA